MTATEYATLSEAEKERVRVKRREQSRARYARLTPEERSAIHERLKIRKEQAADPGDPNEPLFEQAPAVILRAESRTHAVTRSRSIYSGWKIVGRSELMKPSGEAVSLKDALARSATFRWGPCGSAAALLLWIGFELGDRRRVPGGPSGLHGSEVTKMLSLASRLGSTLSPASSFPRPGRAA